MTMASEPRTNLAWTRCHHGGVEHVWTPGECPPAPTAADATHEMCPTCSGAGTVPVDPSDPGYVLLPADDPGYVLVQVDGKTVARVPRDPLDFGGEAS